MEVLPQSYDTRFISNLHMKQQSSDDLNGIIKDLLLVNCILNQNLVAIDSYCINTESSHLPLR